MTAAQASVSKGSAGPDSREMGFSSMRGKAPLFFIYVFTALTGLIVAPSSLHPVLAALSLLCIAVGAGASGALNMWYDADVDALMARTAKRPIPAGRPGRPADHGLVRLHALRRSAERGLVGRDRITCICEGDLYEHMARQGLRRF